MTILRIIGIVASIIGIIGCAKAGNAAGTLWATCSLFLWMALLLGGFSQ